MTRDQIIAKWNGITPRERDAWVAEVVFGHETYGSFYAPNGVRVLIPQYTEDIAAAWSVMEEMRIGYFVALIDQIYGWHVDIEGVYAIGDEAAGTICLASILRKLTPKENDNAQGKDGRVLTILGVFALCACDVNKTFRCDGAIVETGKTRIGGVWIPATKCEKESER
jgi:hypothetical protein